MTKQFGVVLLFTMVSSLIFANSNDSDKPHGNECANIDFKYKPKEATVLFTGFLLPTETQRYIAKLQEAVKGEGIKMNDVVANKMHLTLRFIGFVAPADFQKVKTCLDEFFSDVKVPEITMEPTGFKLLKRDGKPTLLLAKFKSPELEELYKLIDKKVEGFVGKSSHPSFLAHVTVGTFDSDEQKNQNPVQIKDKIKSMNKEQIKLPLENLYLLGLPTENLNTQYQDPTNYDQYYHFNK